MRILLFGNFDPLYGRNRVLLKGIRDNGWKAVVCNGGTQGGWRKFMRLIGEYFLISRKKFDAIVVLFPAQEAMLLGGVLFLWQRWFYGTPVVVDMLTSHYDGYILNRKKYTRRSLHAYWYHWIDSMAIRLADLAIVDSDASGQFFREEFGVLAHKIATIFIGTDDDVMRPGSHSESDSFLVHFHGNMIPHQGVRYIVEAAHLLANENVHFQIIGRGQEYHAVRTIAEEFRTDHIIWIDQVSYNSLPEYINRASVCLGPMGGTAHFDRCAPNKIFEYMACGKAIIVGDSRALASIARSGENMILVPPADANALAQAILNIKNNPELKAALGQRARQDFIAHYTPRRLAALLVQKLHAAF